MIGLGARILGVALEYDLMTIKEMPKKEIMQVLRARESRFGSNVLEAFTAVVGAEAEPQVQTMRLREATPGMRLLQEIRTSSGALLVPIGFELSQRLLERISQVAPEALEELVRLAPARPAAA